MTRAEAWFLQATNGLVAGTGLVYGWMLYLSEPVDEFAVVNHPWQPDVQALHVVLAPALVFACALVWRAHVWARVRSGYPTRRRSGLTLFGLFVPMVASGYLLQVSADEAWRRVWIVLHVATSVIWIGAWIVHQFTPRARAQDVRG